MYPDYRRSAIIGVVVFMMQAVAIFEFSDSYGHISSLTIAMIGISGVLAWFVLYLLTSDQ
jgi:hypothetical protein